jgi:hypothetical protein
VPDSLNRTISSKVVGKDGCVLAIEAAKSRAESYEESGAELQYILMPAYNNALARTRDT